MEGFEEAPAAAPATGRTTVTRQTRQGWGLFLLYLLLYGTFVGCNAFAPAWMEKSPFAGINLAVLSGLGLIAMALLLALFYDWLCRGPEAVRRENTEARR